MGMAEVIDHLHELLEREFPGSTIELEQASPLDKVGGILIWDGFDQMDQFDRQRLLTKRIRDNLKRDEQIRITTILTLTPAENSIPEDC